MHRNTKAKSTAGDPVPASSSEDCARYTISEASRRFAIPRRTLYHWLERGYLTWTPRPWGKRAIPVVTAAQVQEARWLAHETKSYNISDGVNRTLEREESV